MLLNDLRCTYVHKIRIPPVCQGVVTNAGEYTYVLQALINLDKVCSTYDKIIRSCGTHVHHIFSKSIGKDRCTYGA